jgi:hypothetical protein
MFMDAVPDSPAELSQVPVQLPAYLLTSELSSPLELLPPPELPPPHPTKETKKKAKNKAITVFFISIPPFQITC